MEHVSYSTEHEPQDNFAYNLAVAIYTQKYILPETLHDEWISTHFITQDEYDRVLFYLSEIREAECG